MLNIDVENIVVPTDIGHFMVRMNADLMSPAVRLSNTSIPWVSLQTDVFRNVHSLGRL